MIKRKFLPGDEWLYLKIYSGPNLIDELLNEHIYSVVLNLFDRGLINKFFFVRFIDDSFHLRLRFHLTSLDNISEVLIAINEKLTGFVETRMISKITLDTYSREIERYGENNIVFLENLFTYDSFRVLSDLNKKGNEHSERWLIGLKSIDNTLELFGLSILEKQEFYESYYQQYGLEFGSEKLMKEQLKKKQRQYAKLIESLLVEKVNDDELPSRIIEMRDEAIARLSENLRDQVDRKDSFLKSFSHMHFNRVIKNKQRFHEYVIYYLMSNYYRSQIARNKK